jgi:hypothetical protein
MQRARKPLKRADPQPVATHGNRFAAHGKEGVDGSSSSEGLVRSESSGSTKFTLSHRLTQNRDQTTGNDRAHPDQDSNPRLEHTYG